MLSNEDLPLFNNRDRPVFDKVFKHFYPALHLYTCHFVKNETDAEDIVMDLFEELYQSKVPIDKAENIPFYLFRLTKNRCIDFLKKQKRQKAMIKKLTDQYNDNDDNDPQIQDDMLAIDALLTIVNQLPGKYGEVIRLLAYDRLTYPEIAARLNISRNMVSKLRVYAKKEIKNRLNNI
jgi:RNA polymerase sigma-70 factor (ECF subfamily)